MPIFDYKCKQCEVRINDVFVRHYAEAVKCKQCGAKMSKLVPTGIAADVFPTQYSGRTAHDGVYLEHVSPEGQTFYSKKEMKKYAKDKKLELGYL